MDFWWGFMIGLLAGVNIGMVIVALLTGSKLSVKFGRRRDDVA